MMDTVRKRILKRTLDVTTAFLFLLVFSPVILSVSIVLFFEFGSILFTQQRVGRDEEHFRVYKFRTMRTDGEPEPFIDESHRITDAGQVIRRYRLDEFPQLLNVLLGDMSMVGPRPIWTAEYYELVNEYPSWRARQRYKPGLFDPAVAAGLDNTETPLEAVSVQKEYLEQWTVRGYLGTIVSVLAGIR